MLVSSLLGPTAGGIIAGAPIRAGGTIFLEALHKGESSAVNMTRGVVFSMVANVGFALVLYFCLLNNFGLYPSFLVAGIVFAALVAVMITLTG